MSQEQSLVLGMSSYARVFRSLSWQARWVLCLAAVIATLDGQYPDCFSFSTK